jgi:hypothetical protein
LAADIGLALRRLVAVRAEYRCEYCILHEEDAYSPHQIDHIISRKHGGNSTSGNLAYACLRCNAWKGTDIGSADPRTGRIVRLFHPRRDVWDDHFGMRGPLIAPLTDVGRATAAVLKLNLEKRVAERQLLIEVGRYPR